MAMQQWFPAAKLGIFIHWGVYSVDGTGESWPIFLGTIPYDTYMAQAERFTAESYDPRQWAELFEAAGARYAVLTARHHDGVALFDSAVSDLTTVRGTPAGRDLIAPYVEAMRERGLRVGLYFSLSNWSHPDYASVRPDTIKHPEHAGNRMAYAPADQQDPWAWQRFLKFNQAQLDELCTRYGPLDLLWFDGEWERDPEQWQLTRLSAQLERTQPVAVLNGRLSEHGDYATPEQGIPIVPPTGPWELCVTMNDSWGWQPQDDNHKSVRQLVRLFAEVIGLGGNLLLAIGPREDGTFTPEQSERLRALGSWIRRHEEAIFPTGAGLPPGHFHGASTLSIDRHTLYLFAFDPPVDFLEVRGVRGVPRRVTMLGTDRQMRFRATPGIEDVPGMLYVDVPAGCSDTLTTVFKLEYDQPVDLYRGAGRE
ncbi:alpha-L-fucosidase [Luethyella okanaganae]|uniref:alpha-L-fucosidase n=1 Tax=Luethyella okanaganae TaxID=69372 RepID=A0ABW1VFH6_9MICO